MVEGAIERRAQRGLDQATPPTEAAPVAYTLQRALQDTFGVFLAATAGYLLAHYTGVIDLLTTSFSAYPRVQITGLFVYSLLVATAFAVIGWVRWDQLIGRVQREQELQVELDRRARALEDRTEVLEHFASAASHDLREPLRMITSYLDLIDRRSGEALDAEGREFLAYARDGAQRLDGMVVALRDYAQLEHEVEAVPSVAADEALDHALANLAAAIEDAGARVERAPLPPCRVAEAHLVLLFQNLIHNAIKYAGDQPPSLRIGGQRLEGGRVRYWVEDDGPGIPADQQDRIFELFYRGTGSGRGSGSGVGLALCQRIVTIYGGEIHVVSEEGAGATFSFTLPGA